MPEFLRRGWSRYSKLGKRRRKKRVWRRPTGRHNKMREKRKGSAPVVSIGYGSKKETKAKLDGKKPRIVYNLKGLENTGKNEIAVIGKIGKKKKIEISNRAKQMKIEIYNLNPEKFLKLSAKGGKNELKK